MKNPVILIGLLTAMAALVSTATAAGVRTARAEGPVQAGLYTVLLYGQEGPHDPETVALLDLEGDSLTLRPYGADFRTVVKQHVEAAKAEEAARGFVGRMINVSGAEMKEIRGPDGALAGYEFRPIFTPFIFGTTDLLLISYVDRGEGKVAVYIGLHPSYEPPFRTSDDGFEFQ